VAQKIYNGIKRVKILPECVKNDIETSVDILTNPNFCISDFYKLRRVEITDVVNLVVSCLIIYSNFPDGRAPKIYDGKSIQIGFRLETYGKFTTNNTY
jgi:hypothetical protein